MKWEILRNHLTKTGYEVMIIIISHRRLFTIAYPRPKYLVFLSFIRNFAENTKKCIHVGRKMSMKDGGNEISTAAWGKCNSMQNLNSN